MKKIATQIKSANNSIQKRFLADVKRAKGVKACSKAVTAEFVSTSKALFKEINEKTNTQILQSVLVCNTDCLTVSFEREVMGIRQLLGKASSNSQKLAKKVVKCSGSKAAPSNGKAGPRSDTDLNKIVNDTKKILTNCKVCRH